MAHGNEALAAVVLTVCAFFGSTRHIDGVFSSIGDYVAGANGSFQESIGELTLAFKEFEGLSEERQMKLAAKPLNRLIIDFAIKPMRFASQQIGDDRQAHEKYFERMRYVLKLFWPAYKGIPFKNIDTSKKMPKMRELSRLLYGRRNGRKPGMMLFLMADEERTAWIDRMEEIIDHEDIYSNLFELASIWQYLNLSEYRPIHRLLPLVVSGQVDIDKLGEITREPETETELVRFPSWLKLRQDYNSM